MGIENFEEMKITVEFSPIPRTNFSIKSKVDVFDFSTLLFIAAAAINLSSLFSGFSG